MSDLISRKALLAAINNTQPALPDEYNDLILEAAPITPQVVCNITGGLLQGASADHPVDVYTLDWDVSDEEPDELIYLDGGEVRFGQEAALVDPDFVAQVVNTPTLDVAVVCSNCDWSGEIDDLNVVENLSARVLPGETMPAGECPECGCLAHLVKPNEDD